MIFLGSVLDYLRDSYNYRITRARLHDLDDRLLLDIGLRRDQIDALARNMYQAQREQSALDSHNRKNEKARKNTLGGHGLAPQH